MGNLIITLPSSCIEIGALGHTWTPFCSVCRQFFVFIPGDVHVLQISSDDVHPIFPWPYRLSLVAPQLPLYSLTRYSRVLHSQYVSHPPQSLPRDASAERSNATVSRPSVCLSVRLSVTFRYCLLYTSPSPRD